MTAARTGNVDAAKVLLAHGANVDAKESWHGETALMWAVAQKHPDMVARTHRARRRRQRPFERQQMGAAKYGGAARKVDAARRPHAVGCSPRVKVASRAFRCLLEAGADVNAVDPDGISPLLSRIINGHYDVAGAAAGEGRGSRISPTEPADRRCTPPSTSHTMPASNRPSPKEIDNELTSLDV